MAMNLSMQNPNGRVGNPPASKEVIETLPEVDICDKYCKMNDKSGSMEFPRCSICFEDFDNK